MVTQRLKTIAHVIAGQSPSSDDVKPLEEGIPFIQGNAEFGNLHPTPRWECDTATKFAEPGDILVSVRAPVGEVNIADSKIGIGRGLAAIRPKDISLSKWLYFALLSNKEYLNAIATGSTFTAVTTNDIGNIKLTIPENPPDIANQLDRELSKIDDFITEQERLLELTTEKFNAELRKLTSPVGVATVPLKRFAEITLGKMITPSDKGDMELAPYIRAANIQPGGVFTYATDQKKMWFSSRELSYLDLKKNDVLVIEGGASGRSAVLTEDLPGWGFQNSINRVRAKKNLADPYFIHYCLQAQLLFGDLDNLINQSTIPHLTAEKLAQVKVPQVSYKEQIKLSEFLSKKLDEVKEIKQQIKTSIDLLTELKIAKINTEWK